MRHVTTLLAAAALMSSQLAMAAEPVSTEIAASSYSIADVAAPIVNQQNLTEAQDMGSPAAPDYSVKPKKKSSTAKTLAIGAGVVLGLALVGVLGWTGYVSYSCRDHRCEE